MDPARAVARAFSDPEVHRAIGQAATIDILAVGKAAGPMAGAFRAALTRPVRSTLVVAPTEKPPAVSSVDWIVAAHPVPNANSVTAGREALQRAARSRRGDLLVVLVSGGASSLMAAPVAGVPLQDKQQALRLLLRSGADITELNTVRKHLSTTKGGQLAAATEADVLTLVLSDVVGNDVSTIGSGPTVPDPTTFADALAVLTRRGGAGLYPTSCLAYLEAGLAGHRRETPKSLRQASIVKVVASLDHALDAAAVAAAGLGYAVHRVAEPITGEARDAGAVWARHIDDVVRLAPGPWCVLSGGETTVTVTGHGRGGRSQELALSLAEPLSKVPHAAVLSVGTDGVDGPTDAAGAFVDTSTVQRAEHGGLSRRAHLRDNNSYAFFDALGDLLRVGPTGTNVGDLQIALIMDEEAPESL